MLLRVNYLSRDHKLVHLVCFLFYFMKFVQIEIVIKNTI